MKITFSSKPYVSRIAFCFIQTSLKRKKSRLAKQTRFWMAQTPNQTSTIWDRIRNVNIRELGVAPMVYRKDGGTYA